MLIGGDVISKTYTSKASSIGWVQITGYNASQNAIQGIFDVELSDDSAQTVHVKNGDFKALIN
ncbi:hypothetical protein HMF3257_12160 [Spirosoma telluris]|uniref:Uncharacterized protein n=1 Tax=Spirosoma telluris TaxID=2183553 RepID=A0A327NIY8_9BACT|nr:hypothetical protein HMF3257_12160 [Spirosoma telluris]